MTSKAKVTISRRSNAKGSGRMFITIEDRLSGNRVVSVSMDMAEFTECLTGMAMGEAEYEFVPSQLTIDTIGKKRVIKSAFCDKAPIPAGKAEQGLAVVSDFELNHAQDGWVIKDKGLTTQQRGDKHEYTLIKFVDAYEGDCDDDL